MTYQFTSGEGKKSKLPCFALLDPWGSISHLGARAGKKGKLLRVPNEFLCFILVVGKGRRYLLSAGNLEIFLFLCRVTQFSQSTGQTVDDLSKR